jgi:hypothetical protein
LSRFHWTHNYSTAFLNLLNAELNPICHLLALLGAHYLLHISRIRDKELFLLLTLQSVVDLVFQYSPFPKVCGHYLPLFYSHLYKYFRSAVNSIVLFSQKSCVFTGLGYQPKTQHRTLPTRVSLFICIFTPYLSGLGKPTQPPA